MTKHQTPPAPLGVCDMCGNMPALPEPGGRAVYCSACLARQSLQDTAREQLRDVLAPVLGAWADFWTRAGLTPEALAGVFHSEVTHWETPRRFRRAPYLSAVRFLLRRWRPAPYADPGPARFTVRADQLPELADLYRPDPSRGIHWPYFVTLNPDGSRGTYRSAPGLDLLTLELPDGSAVLLPLGYRGALEPEHGSAVRIPARLREAARRLYYPHHETPPAEPLERGEVLP